MRDSGTYSAQIEITEDKVGGVTLEWNNRTIPRQGCLLVFFFLIWLLLTFLAALLACKILDPNLAAENNIGPTIGLIVVALFWIALTISILMSVSRERIEIQNGRCRHSYPSLFWLHSTNFALQDMTQVTLIHEEEDGDGRESILTLNIWHDRKRLMLAYWGLPQFKLMVYCRLKSTFLKLGCSPQFILTTKLESHAEIED